MDQLEPIAVIGLACRFPGAADAGQFWRNLVAGTESVTFFDRDEMRAAGVPDAELDHPDYVPAAPVMPGPDLFDAGLFGMTAREAELCDPQFRVFLEICHAALENAGHDPFGGAGSIGVFASAGPNGYFDHQLRPRPDVIGPAGVVASTLNQTDYAATLVAYKLGLRGPAVTVLTACSSTLVGIHQAAQALRAGECDAAISGGSAVRVPVAAGHRWTPGNILTDDGHCRPFDAAASGTLWGSGAAAVVLKRLEDAVADGDRIRAVLLGSAVNNDGADKVSFSAPSVGGQVEVICEALALAGVGPAEVDLVEAHATGTALGDPVEVAALAQAYRLLDPEPPARRTVLGAVKANIGHLGAVAGIAGFIKTVLSLESEAIPGTVHLRRPNPLLELDETRFELARELRPWPRKPGRRRVAGVTSLGIGGTNAHAVLTEGPVTAPVEAERRPRLVVWSARTAEGERTLRTGLAGFFAGRQRAAFADAVGTLQYGRTAHPVRAAVVADSAAAAATALGGERVITGTAGEHTGVVHLFPGQGTGYERMATGLYGTVRDFTIAMDECLELFDDAGLPLGKSWLEGVDDPLLQQPLLFSVGYSLSAMWRAWTGPPAAVLGHSLGEITAATAAGELGLAQAVRMVTARAQSMAAHPVAGGMLAVAAGVEDTGDLPAGVTLAAVNADRQVVLSGGDAALAEAADRLTARGIAHRRTPAPAPFHHPDWAPAAQVWADRFDASGPAASRSGAWYSARTGGRVDGSPADPAAFWTGQLTAPVRFHDALTALLAEVPPAALVECGPSGVLTGLARKHPALGPAVPVRSLGDDRSDHQDVLEAAARLWVAGASLDWGAAGQPVPVVRAEVPGYPYERKRYWVETAAVTPAPHGPVAVPDGPVAVQDGPVSVPGWVPDVGGDPERTAPGTRALVLLPADPEDALRVVAAVHRAALQPVRVRHGDRYADDGHEFRVRPGEPDDLHRVVAALADRDTVPDVVVHAAGYGRAAPAGSIADRLDEGVLSLLALVRTVLGSSRWDRSPRLVLLTSRSVDVTGSEVVDPARAALLGLWRTFLAESPQTLCTGLDADDRTPADTLAREIARGRPAPVLALRGPRRWRPVDLPVTVPPATGSSLREEGVYLITGGAGGLGLALARGLAGTGLRPRIALLGRRDPETADPDALAGVRALGAQVRGWAADVTDPAALARAADRITAELGPVNGIFHLAGIAGDRMLAFRERADAAAVLAPKALGAAALGAVFADRPALDFVVHYSSRAAVEGLVGNGDYAAANAYLDGDSLASRLARGRVLSVAWPVWRGAGMADTGIDLAALNSRVRDAGAGRTPAPEPADDAVRWETPMDASAVWALDEHRVGRVPLLPGTAYLDLILRAYGEVVAPLDGVPARLDDVVFRVPYLDSASRTLRITFRPTDGGHEVLVESRRTGEGGGWTGHVSARIGTDETGPAEAVDVAALRLRFDAAGELESPAGRGKLFTLGPRWRNITAVRVDGAEKLLRVELPPAFRTDLAEHVLHPALLDTVAAAVRGPGQASSVPFHYGRITVYAPLPATFHAHVRRTPDAEPSAVSGDIDLIGDDGSMLVRIERFTMLMVDEEQLRASAALPPVFGAPPPAADPVQRPPGLDPAEAVTLLLGMLDAGLTGPVHVAHPAGTRPAANSASPAANSAPLARPPQPARVVAPTPQPVAEPETLHTRLRDIWLESLGVGRLVEDQDFFDAGGNSLTAVELAARIRAVLGVELRIGVLLEARTFAELHDVLAEKLADQR